MTLSPLPTKCIGACVLCTRMDQWCVGSFKKKFSGIVIEFEFFFFFLSASTRAASHSVSDCNTVLPHGNERCR